MKYSFILFAFDVLHILYKVELSELHFYFQLKYYVLNNVLEMLPFTNRGIINVHELLFMCKDEMQIVH